MSIDIILICTYCNNRIRVDSYYQWSIIPEKCNICNHKELIKKTVKDMDYYGYEK